MPRMKGNKVGVFMYLTPEAYRELENMRNPYISTSAHCAMIIEEVLAEYRK